MRSLVDKCYVFLVLCLASGVIARVFEGRAALQSGVDASFISGGDRDPVLLAFNLLLGFATLVLAYPKLPRLFEMSKAFCPLLMLYALAAFSILWSVDRLITFRTVVYLFLYLIASSY
ncbi:MAG: hypothetical protein WBV28_05240, partial [Terracidiphilus sp.]